MQPVSSLALFTALAFALAFPALAKTSIQKGKTLCEAEIDKQDPAPKSFRADKESVKASNGTFVYTLRVKNADGSAGKLLCRADREFEVVSLAKAS
jgi:hypothetical protein